MSADIITDASYPHGTPQGFTEGCHGSHCPAPRVDRLANGIPRQVDRLRGLGNAVVPAAAEHIGRLVMEHQEGA